jgi:hypothetical protein
MVKIYECSHCSGGCRLIVYDETARIPMRCPSYEYRIADWKLKEYKNEQCKELNRMG